MVLGYRSAAAGRPEPDNSSSPARCAHRVACRGPRQKLFSAHPRRRAQVARMRALLVLALATGCRDLATLDADAAPPEDAPAVTSMCAPDATLDCHAVAPIWQTGTAAI